MYGIHLNHSIFPFYIFSPEESWGNSTHVTHPDISSHPPSCVGCVTLCVWGWWPADQPHRPSCVLTAPGFSLPTASPSLPSPHIPRRGAQSPRILLLNLLVKLGESLWFARRSSHSSGASSVFESALPFSNCVPRLGTICDLGPLPSHSVPEVSLTAQR